MGKITMISILAACLQFGCLEAEILHVKPFHDFFRKLIEKPAPPPRQRPRTRVAAKAPKKVIPPLQVDILGISGEEGARVAIVNYKGQQMLIEEGDEKKDEFKVLRIDEGKITFLHIRAGKRQEVNF